MNFKNIAITLILLSASVCTAQAVDFEHYFKDATLRVDYIFSGTDSIQHIAVDELRCENGWYGRRVNLDSLSLRGNGRITMRDAKSKVTIYKASFSTLFQEWQTTEEAIRLARAFENVFQLPMPIADAEVTVELCDVRGRVKASLTHEIKVGDILIRPIMHDNITPHRMLMKGGDAKHCIDIAIIAEGYTAEEREKFYADAQIAADEIFKYEPFKKYKSLFNVVAVAPASAESGVSIPKNGMWKNTALASHFDTFYSERYLTTLRLKNLNDVLAGIPYEHIIILANTDNYGGGGIYNSYTLTAAHHPQYRPVLVHEFGHSFAGLADEYFYDDQYSEFYYPDVEPWEQNITTLADFSKKWKNLLSEGTEIPTPTKATAENDMEHIGVYEGGGYQSKGVYRAFRDCRMRTNEAPAFCRVCQNALESLIRFYTKE